VKSRSSRHKLAAPGRRLPCGGACGKRLSSRGGADSSPFPRRNARERPEDAHIEANLKVLTRYLVATFPDMSILSREIGGRYHLFVLVPFTRGAEKAIQVDRPVLEDPALTEEEIVFRLDSLHLPTVLHRCVRVDLGLHNWLPTTPSQTRPESSHKTPQTVFKSHSDLDAHGHMAYGPFPPSGLRESGIARRRSSRQ
jgi:hypothetical protein